MRRRKNEQGIAILTTALLLGVVLPGVGLAIDAGVLYVVKSQMTAASDAAALAAARSLNLGQSVTEQNTIAISRARSFYLSNFPNGYMGTTNSSISTTLTYLDYATLQVAVTTSVDAPIYFMRLLRSGTPTVRALGTATRRNVNLVLVLDKSGSMADTSTIKPCTSMKSNAATFLSYFANGRDRIGLVSFNGAWTLEQAPTTNFLSTIPSKINALTCSGSTGTAQAINNAYTQLTNLHEPLALNVMVFFTDGQPTALTADFPLRMRTTQSYGNNSGTSASTFFPSPCNNPGNTCNMEPSTCKDTNGNSFDRNSGQGSRTYNAPAWNPNWFNQGAGGLATLPTYRGFIADYGSSANTGATAGPLQYNPAEANPTVGTSCAFRTDPLHIRRDLAYIPSTDIYGNATSGYKSDSTLDYFPVGHPYAGNIRVDRPIAVNHAATNAADDQGRRVRADATYNPVIYCIGLGGNPGNPPDTEFMTRLSNDGSSTDTYGGDSDRPRGLYVYSPNTAQLNQAFAIIASSVLRLSR